MTQRSGAVIATALAAAAFVLQLSGCGLLSDETEQRSDGTHRVEPPWTSVKVEIAAVQFKDAVVVTRTVIDSVGARHGLAYLWPQDHYKEEEYFVDRRVVPASIPLDTIVQNVRLEQQVKAARGFSYWIALDTYENRHAPAP